MTNAMPLKYITFDTLNFVKRLEAVGVSPKVAETQAELYGELQEKVVANQLELEIQLSKQQELIFFQAKAIERVAENQPYIDEFKICKTEFATKSYIGSEIARLENVFRTEFATKSDFQQLEAKIVVLDSRITAMESRMTSMESRMTAIESHVAVLDSKLNALDARVTIIEAKIDALDSKIDMVEEKLTDKLSHLRNDIVVKLGSVMAAGFAVLSTIMIILNR